MYPSSWSSVFGLFVHQQVKELQRQGCEVKVIAPAQWAPFPVKHFSKEWKGYSQVPAVMTWDGIEVHYPRYLEFPRAFSFATSGVRMYLGIKKLVEEIHKDFDFDIIHAHVALPDGFAAMMLNRRYRKPLVVTIHGADLFLNIHRSRWCRKALRKVFEQADKTVLVSPKLRELAVANIGYPEKLVVIPNGIDPQAPASPQQYLASRYAGYRIVLSVSHLIKRKGIDVNLRAISQLRSKYPNLKYLVIGDGPERASLARLTHELEMESQVEFLGQMPHDKVMEYMALSEVFSLPSWDEAFGVVYLEAAMNGKPVIACKGEGIADVLQDRQTALFVEPKNVGSLAGAIDFLLANPQQARDIGQKAKLLVLENYTWARNARKHMEFYWELLTENAVGIRERNPHEIAVH